MARTALEQYVRQPNWYNLPIFAREEIFRNTLKAAHQAAAATMQASHPEIIQQAIDNKERHIQGLKPAKLSDVGALPPPQQ